MKKLFKTALFLCFVMRKALLICVLLISGCVQNIPVQQIVVDGCIKSCLSYDEDKSDGPCLSNNIYPDWVCDVAHDPREVVDDIPENQCEKFQTGEAHHFVEVTPGCEFIRAQ